MLSRLKLLTFSRQLCKSCKDICHGRTYAKERDTKQIDNSLYALFFNNEVQDWLKLLTHIDEAKVFEKRAVGETASNSKFVFLTTEELEERRAKIKSRIDYLMQMPPVLLPRPEVNEVLDEHPGLDGHDLEHAKIIFTDISKDSYGERVIVVREPNGVLRKAYWDERKRMTQMFFPKNGRELYTPKMFEEKNLNALLERKEYKFILDRACIQFEPDEAEYIDVTAKTYNEINNQSDFKDLLSTRHFGSLTFYLVLHKNIDNMIIDNFDSDRIDDVYLLLKVYNKIHCFTPHMKNEKLLQTYIESESKNREKLELAMRNYQNRLKGLSEENDLEKRENVN